jgi:hypothetical protein
VLDRLRLDKRGSKVSVIDLLVLGLITRILKGVIAIILNVKKTSRAIDEQRWKMQEERRIMSLMRAVSVFVLGTVGRS